MTGKAAHGSLKDRQQSTGVSGCVLQSRTWHTILNVALGARHCETHYNSHRCPSCTFMLKKKTFLKETLAKIIKAVMEFMPNILIVGSQQD